MLMQALTGSINVVIPMKTIATDPLLLKLSMTEQLQRRGSFASKPYAEGAAKRVGAHLFAEQAGGS